MQYSTIKNQDNILRCYALGHALHHLKEKYKHGEWNNNIQDFFKINNFKLRKTAECELRRFYIDIGPYRKLLFTNKSYTELKNLSPRIKDVFAIYPEEKEFWKM